MGYSASVVTEVKYTRLTWIDSLPKEFVFPSSTTVPDAAPRVRLF